MFKNCPHLGRKLFKINIRYFSSMINSTLRDKKLSLKKEKAMENILKIKQIELKAEAINEALKKLNLLKTIIRLGSLFIGPFFVYYFHKFPTVPKGSKTLTDLFNLTINSIMTGMGIFVKMFNNFLDRNDARF